MEILEIVGKGKKMGTLHGALHGEGTGSKGRLKQALLSVLVAVFIMTATAATADAWQNVGGGTWREGWGITTVFSNYHHPGNYHGSTAIGKIRAYSGCTTPGIWSQASSERTGSGTNKTFWNNIC